MTATALNSRASVYDSDLRLPPLVDEASHLWSYRGLLRLIVVRDLTVRYKRSFLGVWWTLLNPVLTTAVMWIVFSAVFRFATPGRVPFIVYLMSGVLLINFFSQGLITVGNAIVGSAGILSKVYVPPEVFAVAAAVAAAVNFTISLLPLLALQLVTGQGVPWSALLVPLPILAMLCFVTGLGLIVSTAAIRFPDTLDLVVILVTLLSYLTPIFYPLSIIPTRLKIFIEFNPLYSYLTVFRDIIYGGQTAPWWTWVVMLTTSVLTLLGGTWFFSRRWRTLVALL